MTIKDVRIAQKLSQGELAEALGISVSSERSYEYGVRKPSAKVIEKIKAVYGVDLSDEAPSPAVEETVEKAAAPAVAETPAKSKRGRKKKEAAVEAAPAPAVEEKAAEVETVEEAPAKPKRGRKKKDAAPAPAAEEAPASEEKAEKAEEAPAKKPRTRRKKNEPAAASTPVDESLLQMQTNAEAAVHALFDAKGTVIIQSPMGGEITPEEVLAKVGPVDKVYVRVDENKAYWTRGDESGAVDLW